MPDQERSGPARLASELVATRGWRNPSELLRLRIWAEAADPAGLDELGIDDDRLAGLDTDWLTEVARFTNDWRASLARVLLDVLAGGPLPADPALLRRLAARADVVAQPLHGWALVGGGDLTVAETVVATSAASPDARLAAFLAVAAHAEAARAEAHSTAFRREQSHPPEGHWGSSLTDGLFGALSRAAADADEYLAGQLTALVGDAGLRRALLTDPTSLLTDATTTVLAGLPDDHGRDEPPTTR
jgi:hypothetical protein